MHSEKKETRMHLAQQWAARINSAQGDAIQSVIAMGNLLVSAKAELKHGEWERMFTGHKEPVEDPIKFTARTANRLMAIAGNPLLVKSAHASDFPQAWTTLYELSRLDEPTLSKAIEEGRITPETQRKDVRAMRSVSSREGSRRHEYLTDDTVAESGEVGVDLGRTAPAVVTPIGKPRRYSIVDELPPEDESSPEDIAAQIDLIVHCRAISRTQLSPRAKRSLKLDVRALVVMAAAEKWIHDSRTELEDENPLSANGRMSRAVSDRQGERQKHA
jgi:hypothetical protein